MKLVFAKEHTTHSYQSFNEKGRYVSGTIVESPDGSCIMYIDHPDKEIEEQKFENFNDAYLALINFEF